jgi:peptidoglycan/LPS O-acetylase OafA/YrhL
MMLASLPAFADGHIHSTDKGRYRIEIDGLRCIAVAPVVLFHAGITAFSGGFVGVDVFFVISGYLITGILYREGLQERFSIFRFYERRIRRIFPALFAMLAVVLFASLFVLLPDEMVSLGKQIGATTLFASNLLFWSEAGYFDSDSISKPLLHTWSLAVEEQFYILFPLALWLIIRWRARLLLPAMIAVAVSSLVLSVLMLGHYPSSVFYLLPTRAYELMIGGMVAVVPAYRGRFADPLSWAGLAAILGAVLLYNESIEFPGIAALPPCLGAAAILWASQGTTCGRLISNSPMRGIGLISYSLYLWHWPIIVLLGLELGRPLPGWSIAVAIISSLLLAWLSWRYVEQPLRRTANVSRVWVTGAVCLTGGVLASLALVATDGLPQRFPERSLAIIRKSIAEGEAMQAAYACATESLDRKSDRLGPCPIGIPNGRIELVVIGDSDAMALKPAFSEALARMRKRGTLISTPGCTPMLGLDQVADGARCAEHARQIFDYVRRVKPDAVVFVASWRGVLTKKNTVADGVTSSNDVSRLANVRRTLMRTVGAYRSTGGRVGFLLPLPGTQNEVPRALARRAQLPLAWSAAEHTQTFAGLQTVVAQARPDIVGNLAEGMCKRECLVLTPDGKPLYWDRTHPNAAGNRLVEPAIERTLRRLVPH